MFTFARAATSALILEASASTPAASSTFLRLASSTFFPALCKSIAA